jgi:hypothetical protein
LNLLVWYLLDASYFICDNAFTARFDRVLGDGACGTAAPPVALRAVMKSRIASRVV